ncbi:MAG: TerC family protein [Chitinophagales bacterium]|nr:TerC family protein [Chitinophagales bacterium]MDW8427923.1 TerC family protein [Chitinophagales bacterium]
MFTALTTAEGWMSLVTLIVMEIILGIDNIIFISILADKLPKKQRPRARIIGLSLALIMRVILLFSISWLTKLTAPLLTVNDFALSARDLILLSGGVFLLYKTVREIHNKIEGIEVSPRISAAKQFGRVIFQIILIDMVFSVDSILTAVGLVDDMTIMVIAVVVAIVFMMLFAGWVSAFIDKNPTFKMLALSFLLMVGFLLVADGLHYHIDKKYLYFSMAFAFLVEFLNMRERRTRERRLKQQSDVPLAE